MTPTQSPTKSIGEVFFLNKTNGWILSNDDPKVGSADQPFYLLSTQDGGRHWSSLMLQRSMFGLTYGSHDDDDYYAPTQIFFADTRHGWIAWRWHLMNTTSFALLATSDGGRTWKRLPDPPGGGPLQFLSAKDGWMIGEDDQDTGIPVQEDAELWSTQDGGLHWKPIRVPVPPDLSEFEGSPVERLSLLALRVMSPREIMAAAMPSEESGASFPFVSLFTTDGGATWRHSQFVAYNAEPSIGGKHIFWSVIPELRRLDRHRISDAAILQMESEPVPLAIPDQVSREATLQRVDFFDDSNAWLSYRKGLKVFLTATTDQGKTSKIIWSGESMPDSISPDEKASGTKAQP